MLTSALENKRFLPKNFALALLAASYLAGLIGLLLPQTRLLFQALTPFHLLLTSGLLFWFHRDWSRPFLLFCAIAFLVGYGIEVLGVHTGAVFGHYWYGESFGLKVLEVPLLIGLNWLVLVYCCGIICAPLQLPTPLKAALAAALMVGLDFLIEPISAKFDFWYWQDNIIPAQNFIAWYLTAYGLIALFYVLPLNRSNSLARPIYIMQLLFFASLLLFT
jgi:uncharacterized membrane protein